MTGVGSTQGAFARRPRIRGSSRRSAILSDSEVNALIFAPGFSTAKEVSALSGRGVGMDVVKRTIEGMRGAIDVVTAPNRGTTITLRLPLTLAIIEGLLVRVADTKYVIPLTAVEECVELTDLDNERSEGRSFLNIRGDLIPFLRLRDLFTEAGRADAFQKIVIVSTGDFPQSASPSTRSSAAIRRSSNRCRGCTPTSGPFRAPPSWATGPSR